ncbi:MAG: hypothetical protein II192_02770 [Clostridia bacterium]|nr:hypothetical protein [Clostridia bacterium]
MDFEGRAAGETPSFSEEKEAKRLSEKGKEKTLQSEQGPKLKKRKRKDFPKRGKEKRYKANRSQN